MLPDFETAQKMFQTYQIDVPRGTFEKLEIYADFLVEYNQRVNLTAITDGQDILRKHFLDSFLLYHFAEKYFPDSAKILDIGSGAGFPGVPLALLKPDFQITLLDSLGKRITFLKLLKEKLNCNYQAIHGRAEEFAKRSDYREAFDVVTARAVASLPMLAEFSLPYVKLNGYWLAMKGKEDISPAISAIQKLGGNLEQTISYQLPDGDERTLFIIKKISPTPTKFPRKFAQIKQKPL
ncbi:MAG: 16S rRNA (guanine(527)-N(7))-methyltransferase RsmG [Oscillospiraceae bacterium]|nr:16S rRNA (guanine(527)-N(7))-methyltransferase RsmG [Oscillospiraceae bacterium]MBR7085568.1 16S rRNA (guanine(527)-N(7))-methyltransferase RsmG [Oscillospiraceae bacterium]